MASPHRGVRPVLCETPRGPASQATKAVHFDNRQYVRRFHPEDLVTVLSSAERVCFGTQDSQSTLTWEMSPLAATLDSPARKNQPVRLEQVWLSPGETCIHGSASVANLAYAKSVTCRLSFDSWTTVLDVPAEYREEILPRANPQGHDRFMFTIPLPGPDRLETLHFCLRYFVNGQEFWDNNDGQNFRLDFKKKAIIEGFALPSHQKKSWPPAWASRGLSNRYNFTTSLKATIPWPRTSDAVTFHDYATTDRNTQIRCRLAV